MDVTTAPRLEVISLEAKNIRGARRVILEPGKVTIFRGRNGTGKTSALEAIRGLLGGGSLATIQRTVDGLPDGEPEGVIYLGERDQPPAYRVTKSSATCKVGQRIEDKGVATRAFKDIPKPQTFLDSLFDADGANPITFLRLAEKDLIPAILNAVPLSLDQAHLAEILGEDAEGIQGYEQLKKLHPIEQLAAIRTALFTARTGVHRDRDGARRTADRIKQSIPAIIESGKARERLVECEAEYRALSDRVSAAKASIETERKAARAAAKAAQDSAHAMAKERRDRLVAEAEAAFRQEITEADKTTSDAYMVADQASAKALQDIEGDTARLHAIDQEIATTRGAIELNAKNQTLADEAALAESDEARHAAHAARLTARMRAIDDLQKALAKALPVEGLEIRPACDTCRDAKVKCTHEGIYLDGVPQEQANTARRIKMAVDLALLRTAGTRLPWLVFDGAENLDSQAFAALVDELKRRPGVQAFIARVEDRPLRIEDSDGRTAGLVELEDVPVEATA